MPQNPEIRYHLAAILNKSGRKAEAREEVFEALKGQAHFDGIEEARALEKLLSK
jgi:Flp pilus assembly protein TadD